MQSREVLHRQVLFYFCFFRYSVTIRHWCTHQLVAAHYSPLFYARNAKTSLLTPVSCLSMLHRVVSSPAIDDGWCTVYREPTPIKTTRDLLSKASLNLFCVLHQYIFDWFPILIQYHHVPKAFPSCCFGHCCYQQYWGMFSVVILPSTESEPFSKFPSC